MCDPLVVIIHNVQNIKSSHDSTYKTDIDTRLKIYGSWYAGTLIRMFFVGCGMCVPAKVICER